MRTVGLFGGMFDPPHLGHLSVVRAAPRGLGLEVLVVTVAARPRHRAEPTTAPELRLAMARAAFEGEDRTVVSDLELAREGPTYTVDTVEALLAEDPDVAVVLVLGADAAAHLAGWHRAADLAGLVEVAVVPRPGADDPPPTGFRTRALDMAPVELSSTEVRRALEAGADPRGLVPDRVVPLLAEHRLYSP